MKLSTRDIVYIGFIAALCAVATTIRIEIPGGAMVHLGSAALFTTCLLYTSRIKPPAPNLMPPK